MCTAGDDRHLPGLASGEQKRVAFSNVVFSDAVRPQEVGGSWYLKRNPPTGAPCRPFPISFCTYTVGVRLSIAAAPRVTEAETPLRLEEMCTRWARARVDELVVDVGVYWMLPLRPSAFRGDARRPIRSRGVRSGTAHLLLSSSG